MNSETPKDFDPKQAAKRSLEGVEDRETSAKIKALQIKRDAVYAPFENKVSLPVSLSVPAAVLELMRLEHASESDLAVRLSEDLVNGFLRRLNSLREGRGEPKLVTPEEALLEAFEISAQIYSLSNGVTVAEAKKHVLGAINEMPSKRVNPLVAATLRRNRAPSR